MRLNPIPNIPPMPHQMEFWRVADGATMENPPKRFILSWPRRGGKDLCSCSYLIREAMTRKGTYWILAPTKTQAVGIYWNTKVEVKYNDVITGKPTKSYGSILDVCIPNDLRAKTNITDKSITLHNGSIIKLGGTSDESFVGQTGVGFVITEYSLDRHSDYMLALLNPILTQSSGWLIVNGTQRTEDNRLNKIINDTKDNKRWFTSYLTMADLNEYCWVSKKDPDTKIREFNINPELLGTKHYLRKTPIENIQDTVDSEPHRKSFYMREYLNIPTSLEESAYYEDAMGALTSSGNINNIDNYHNLVKPVYTSWDLGLRDHTAITFFQMDNENKYPIIIDYYENKSHGVGHYIDYLRTKPYDYGNHFVPVDAGAKSYQMGIDLVQFAWQTFDFRMHKIHKTVSLKADIELVREILPNVTFIESTTRELIKHLWGYHENPNTGKPDHTNGGSSHGADSFRYMCVALNANIVHPILSSRGSDFTLPTKVEDNWDTEFTPNGLPFFAE